MHFLPVAVDLPGMWNGDVRAACDALGRHACSLMHPIPSIKERAFRPLDPSRSFLSVEPTQPVEKRTVGGVGLDFLDATKIRWETRIANFVVTESALRARAAATQLRSDEERKERHVLTHRKGVDMPRRTPLGVRNGERDHANVQDDCHETCGGTKDNVNGNPLQNASANQPEIMGFELVQVEIAQRQIQDMVDAHREEAPRQTEFETWNQEYEHVFVPFSPLQVGNKEVSTKEDTEGKRSEDSRQEDASVRKNGVEGVQTDHPSLLHRLLVKQIHNLHTENERLKVEQEIQSSEVNTMHADLEAESTQAVDRLEVAKTRLRKKTQELEEKAKEIRGLESTIAQLNAVLSRKDQDLSRYQTLLQKCEGRLEEVQTASDRCKKKLEDQIVVALRKVADTRSNMAEVKEELSESRRKVNILEASKKAEVEELSVQVQKLKSQKGELQGLLVRKTAEHEKLEAELRAMGEELKQTQKIVEESRAADAESQMEFENLLGQVRILECEVRDLFASQNEQKTLAEAASKDKSKVLRALQLLQKQFEQLKLELAQERISNARESSRVAELEQSNLALTERCEQAEQSTCKLQGEIQEFKHAKTELEGVNDYLRTRLEKLEKQPNTMYEELQAMIKMAEQNAEELETLLQQERQNNAHVEAIVEQPSPPRRRHITWKRVVILPLAYAIMTLSRTIAHQRRRKNIFELERKKLLSRKYTFSS